MTSMSSGYNKFPYQRHRFHGCLRIVAENEFGLRIKSLVQFDTKLTDLTSDQKVYHAEYAKMNFSVAGFNVEFRRKSTVYLASIYLPSALFVMISWLRYHMAPK